MQSTNLTPSELVELSLKVRFKQYLNIQLKTPLYLYNPNLYGRDELFVKWLSKQGINDLELYLKNIEVNTTKLSHYKRVAKHNNNKTNREL